MPHWVNRVHYAKLVYWLKKVHRAKMTTGRNGSSDENASRCEKGPLGKKPHGVKIVDWVKMPHSMKRVHWAKMAYGVKRSIGPKCLML